MNQDNLTDETLADASRTSAADGGAAVDSSTLTLAELSSYLGKNFPDKETALKSLKDTQSFVGKKREDIEAEVRASVAPAATQTSPEVAQELSSIKTRLFFSDHPEYKGYEAIIAKMGSDPSAVVGSDEFKQVFESGKVADEVSKTRSVVASSARVGQAAPVLDNAIKVANATRSTEQTAEALARGIIEAGGF